MNLKKHEHIIQGKTASPGYAIGRIFLGRALPQPPDRKGDPVWEKKRFTEALNTAGAQLERLKSRVDHLGAQILDFQLELIADYELTGTVFHRIACGQSAVEAWKTELDVHVSDYLAAVDEDFRARAGDFMDLRDRVISLLYESVTPFVHQGPGTIYIADDLAPSRFLEIDWSSFRGAALAQGSAANHMAILARARGVPMLFGLGQAIHELEDGAQAILDGNGSILIEYPRPKTIRRYENLISKQSVQMQHIETFLAKPAYTAKGHHIRIFINVDDPKSLTELDPRFCDGVGLVRTELMLYNPEGLPSEEEQYRIYANLLKWADNRPVVIRTLDSGGDKSSDGLASEGERNPFMGLRGVRLSLVRTKLFRIQLRALARAAAHGPLKVMLPMVTDPKEINQVRILMNEEVENLQRRGVAAQMPPLGMMVEVPVAALRIHAFEADFYSVGSNDLIQFATAACRDCDEVAALYDPLNPAILELIRRVAAHGAATDKEVSLCGDMAADPECIPAILDVGIKSLSVAPAALAKVKKAVSQYGKRYG